jgi:hypothetical protein
MRRILVLFACLFSGAVAVHAAGASLRIVPIVRDDSVIVSVELSDAYTEEVRAAIASGLQTSFTYELELKMDVPAWADRTVASAYAQRATEGGHATVEGLRAVSDAWRDWGEKDDGWFCVLHGEILCRKEV